MPDRVLVLGVGNLLLQDEGFGPHMVAFLQNHYDFPDYVQVVDGGTAGLELLTVIEKCDKLLLIDAVKTDSIPGSAVKIDGEDLPVFFERRISPHQLGLSEVLAMADANGDRPAEIVLFGIVPVGLEISMDLTPEVEAKVEEVASSVIAQLTSWGVEVKGKGGQPARI